MRWIHFFFVEDPRNASCPRPWDIPRSGLSTSIPHAIPLILFVFLFLILKKKE